MILTAHQSNFFPYEGVLQKIAAADRVVMLAHVQFTRNNYHNRFLHRGKWQTMSVNQSLEPLIVKRYCRPHEDWRRIKERVCGFYDLSAFDDCIGASLVDTNVAILRRILMVLGIKTEVVLDEPTDITATDRLVDLCRKHRATTYLSGKSGPKYMDMEKFADAGIRVDVFRSTGARSAVEVLNDQAIFATIHEDIDAALRKKS